jgi:serine protease Do
MMDEQELYDLLDKYSKGELSHEQSLSVKKKMMTDEDFRRKAEEHLKVIQSLRLFGRRESVRKSLEEVQLESPLTTDDTANQKPPLFRNWSKYWPATAIAASVALVSVLGTLLVTQFNEKEQTAKFIEAVRKVEQKQNLIINNMATSTQKEKKEAPPKVQPGRYAGTGFLVSSNGYLITSHHVVKGADSVYVENEVLGSFKAAVVYSDAANDLSVLRIEKSELKLPKLPYTISSNEANLGEDVFTLGFPREDIVFGEGSISALSGYRQNPNSYQVSVPVNPGNSGGPLFNSKGDLVGIISGIQTETSGAAFAIKSSILLDVINGMPVDSVHSPVVLPRYNSMRALSKVDQVNKWKDNVFIVRVYNNK